jgi:2-oxoglutarate ferredoxin oxidoreductase subunit delta
VSTGLATPAPRFWRTPLDAGQLPVPRGEVVILADRCKGCGFCVEYCPRQVLVLASAFNRKGYHPPEVALPDGCVACNLCEMICPEFAIYALPVIAGVAADPAAASAGSGPPAASAADSEASATSGSLADTGEGPP